MDKKFTALAYSLKILVSICSDILDRCGAIIVMTLSLDGHKIASQVATYFLPIRQIPPESSDIYHSVNILYNDLVSRLRFCGALLRIAYIGVEIHQSTFQNQFLSSFLNLYTYCSVTLFMTSQVIRTFLTTCLKSSIQFGLDLITQPCLLIFSWIF